MIKPLSRTWIRLPFTLRSVLSVLAGIAVLTVSSLAIYFFVSITPPLWSLHGPRSSASRWSAASRSTRLSAVHVAGVLTLARAPTENVDGRPSARSHAAMVDEIGPCVGLHHVGLGDPEARSFRIGVPRDAAIESLYILNILPSFGRCHRSRHRNLPLSPPPKRTGSPMTASRGA
jgi:hypothetical protein